MGFRGKLSCFINEQHWTLGFIEQPLKDIVEGKPYEIVYVKGMPHDRWFADPFILDYDDETIQLLVEEFCYSINRGRIARLEISRTDYQLLSYKIILDLPTHLSFPFIIYKDEKVCICPENSASGEWNMYEYDRATDLLTKVKTIVQEPLTDAISTSITDRELIFATKIPNQNGKELSCYNAIGVKLFTFNFSSNIARNAGNWFKIGDKIYRPAQDCNGGYGRAVIIQEVVRDGESFCFHDVRRIVSTNPHYSTGCHTFNNYKDLSVIDVHGWRRPLGVKVFELVKKL